MLKNLFLKVFRARHRRVRNVLDEETVAVQFDTRDKPTHYQTGGGSKEDPCINLWFQTGLQRHSDQKCKRLKEGKWHCQK